MKKEMWMNIMVVFSLFFILIFYFIPPQKSLYNFLLKKPKKHRAINCAVPIKNKKVFRHPFIKSKIRFTFLLFTSKLLSLSSLSTWLVQIFIANSDIFMITNEVANDESLINGTKLLIKNRSVYPVQINERFWTEQ